MNHLRCEAVVNHRAPITIYGHTIVVIHLVTGQHQDHLHPRKGAHKATMFLTEPNHRLGGGKGEVHAGLKQEVITLGELVEVETFGMTYGVGDRLAMFGDHDECRMTGEPVSQSRQASGKP